LCVFYRWCLRYACGLSAGYQGMKSWIRREMSAHTLRSGGKLSEDLPEAAKKFPVVLPSELAAKISERANHESPDDEEEIEDRADEIRERVRRSFSKKKPKK